MTEVFESMVADARRGKGGATVALFAGIAAAREGRGDCPFHADEPDLANAFERGRAIGQRVLCRDWRPAPGKTFAAATHPED